MKTNKGPTPGPQPEPWWGRIRRRIITWRLHQYFAQSAASALGSGAVSLILLWFRSRY
ncbi:hypothetical protein ABT300_34475 [Streptomyces sp. NPDC001027]|uniref:hypothetical protein n=1 Tax=Streptomyces sp. NPDC001027 TaxID=3154771 RepID=UPI00331C405E